MQHVQLAKTANRSVLGILNEFTFLARETGRLATADLPERARWLSHTPCGPLFKRHVSPDRELQALVAALQAPPLNPATRVLTESTGRPGPTRE